MINILESGEEKMSPFEIAGVKGGINIYCPYCMKKLESAISACPSCGKVSTDYCPSSHHIPPNTVLKNRYVVGKCLGEGGFGITYIGLDEELNRKVAIKEYFPNVFVYRESSVKLDVTCYTEDKVTLYERGRQLFLEEARVMARLDEVNEIVRVLDHFATNNTAYIIMECLTGKTLRQYLAEQSRIPLKYLLDMMEPMIRAIDVIHEEGIIHRDISPDNIMLLNNGRIKLLDFGCARNIDREHTMTVMLKHGYAPSEQYTGYDQGPWTDVYALCATLYRCLTGQVPPPALDRMGEQDPIIPLRKLGAVLADQQERAIMKGLAVKPKDRWQSMSELYAALYKTELDPDETQLVFENGGRATSPLYGNDRKPSSNEFSREKSEGSSEDLQRSQTGQEEEPKINYKRSIGKIIAAVALLSLIIVMASVLNKPKTDVVDDKEQGAEVKSGEVNEPNDLTADNPAADNPAADNPVIDDAVESNVSALFTGELNYEDADEINYKKAVSAVTELDLFETHLYGDAFSPTFGLSRSEACKIVAYMMTGPETALALLGVDRFEDVPHNHWASGYVDYCAAIGIINGVTDTLFDPDGELTRVDFEKMLLSCLGYDAEKEGFIGVAYLTNVSAIAHTLNLEEGLPSSWPDTVLTREEAAQMVYNTLFKQVVRYKNGQSDAQSTGVTLLEIFWPDMVLK